MRVSDPARVRPPTVAINLEPEDFQWAGRSTEGHIILEGEVLFEVEFICGKRVSNGVAEYCMQWAGGFPERHSERHASASL